MSNKLIIVILFCITVSALAPALASQKLEDFRAHDPYILADK